MMATVHFESMNWQSLYILEHRQAFRTELMEKITALQTGIGIESEMCFPMEMGIRKNQRNQVS